jgi:hypothetical protein
MHFVANQDFFSEEMQSAYTKGLRYTVREGNNKLAAEVAKWTARGLVKEARRPAAKMRGQATVTDKEIGA